MTLRDTWIHCFGFLPALEDVCHLLEALYSANDRHYHNQDHIVNCIKAFERDFPTVAKLDSYAMKIYLAIFFHDAIYNTHDNKNEENSAKLFKSLSNKFVLDSRDVDNICQSIILTKHDYRVKNLSTEDSIVLDVDLSALASSKFEEDEQKIRLEYLWVPDNYFWPKRKEFLEGLLNQDTIYHTEYYISVYEKQARENIKASIERINTIDV